MKTSPAISVVIIFLDAKLYLKEAIASVMAQTWTDWELLLVDDGSKDYSTRIAQKCAAKFPGKVRYLDHPGHENRGMSAARNLGIHHARGRYVAFLDADDVWLPHKLEEQYAILHAHPEIAMVYGPMELWFSWTGRPEDAQRDYLQPLGHPPDAIVQPPDLVLGFLRDELHIPSGILIRSEIIRAVGGFEDEFRTSYEDVVFHAKVGLRFPVFASSRSWFRYRQHPKSCDAIQKNTGTHRAHRRRYLEWLERHMRQHEFRGAAWKQLRRELLVFRHPWLHLARRGAEEVWRIFKNVMKALIAIALPQSWQRWIVREWRNRRIEVD